MIGHTVCISVYQCTVTDWEIEYPRSIFLNANSKALQIEYSKCLQMEHFRFTDRIFRLTDDRTFRYTNRIFSFFGLENVCWLNIYTYIHIIALISRLFKKALHIEYSDGPAIILNLTSLIFFFKYFLYQVCVFNRLRLFIYPFMYCFFLCSFVRSFAICQFCCCDLLKPVQKLLAKCCSLAVLSARKMRSMHRKVDMWEAWVFNIWKCTKAGNTTLILSQLFLYVSCKNPYSTSYTKCINIYLHIHMHDNVNMYIYTYLKMQIIY